MICSASKRREDQMVVKQKGLRDRSRKPLRDIRGAVTVMKNIKSVRDECILHIVRDPNAEAGYSWLGGDIFRRKAVFL